MLLLTADQLVARRLTAARELAPLADSLTADLEPLLGAPPYIPAEKALLSRVGGRCETDGTDLDFDPLAPHAHRCPACGRMHTGEWHDRWWLYPYQLWLAERAVHAAALHALRGDERHAGFARAILSGYADRYLEYPNRDNVLGPSRLFFSTYLESLWLLHVCVATDLLEAAGDARTANVVRDRIAEPAVTLIEAYHEGMSNRQVWNAAAIIAARALLGEGGDSGAIGSALADTEATVLQAVGQNGAWYEGDNYHQFAHRGLWYVVSLGERLGYEFQRDTLARFNAGFAAPYRSALPDFTFPSRKDARYAASLRQWRFAESCELGLARDDDPLLRWALARMYADDIPAGDTGRSRSSGEAERNMPAVRLSRADLGWRSLLCARATLPNGTGSGPDSITLASQGLTIHRRAEGAVYVALDWGESGGGHGHPDRLNVLFSHGTTRWLDDLGTGSYVDPSLHWYRSTLAHNAPLADGMSQRRVNGRLTALAHEHGYDVVGARADGMAAGLSVERTIVTAADYFVDEVRWWSDRPVRFELPMHYDGESRTMPFVASELRGGNGVEDGFDFVHDAECAQVSARSPVRLVSARDGRSSSVDVWSDTDAEWFRVLGPGQPASETRRFHVVRQNGMSGVIRSVWTWSAAASEVRFLDNGVEIAAHGGIDRHGSSSDGWSIVAASGIEVVATRASARGGDQRQDVDARGGDQRQDVDDHGDVDVFAGLDVPRVFDLGEAHYRRSEDAWDAAGRPTARVTIRADTDAIVVDIAVDAGALVFVPRDATNPFDNEHPDINGHGVQLYFASGAASGAWMLVPELPGPVVRVRRLPGWGDAPTPEATWQAMAGGFDLHTRIPCDRTHSRRIAMDVIVNDAAAGRTRRRGQLVMSGAQGEFVYLRGDRHDPSRLIGFSVP